MPQIDPVRNRLEPDELRYIYTLTAFLDDMGAVGWGKLREFEEDLPDLVIDTHAPSNKYIFKDNDVKIGEITSTYTRFGTTNVQGSWSEEHGYHKFVDNANHALTALEISRVNEGVLSEEDLAALSQNEPQL